MKVYLCKVNKIKLEMVIDVVVDEVVDKEVTKVAEKVNKELVKEVNEGFVLVDVVMVVKVIKKRWCGAGQGGWRGGQPGGILQTTGATVREAALLTYNSHCVQLKGFSPEWVSKCVLRLPAVVEE